MRLMYTILLSTALSMSFLSSGFAMDPIEGEDKKGQTPQNFKNEDPENKEKQQSSSLPKDVSAGKLSLARSLPLELALKILDYATNYKNKILDNPDLFYQRRPNQKYSERLVLCAFRQVCKSWEEKITPILLKIPCLLTAPSLSYPSLPGKDQIMYPFFITLMDLNLWDDAFCQQVYKPDNPFKNIVSFRFFNHIERKKIPFDETSVKCLKALLNTHAKKIKYLTFNIPINPSGEKVLLEYLPQLTNLEMFNATFSSIPEKRHRQLIKALPDNIKKICLQHVESSDLSVITGLLPQWSHLNTVILINKITVERELTRSHEDDWLLKTYGYTEIDHGAFGATEDSLQTFIDAVTKHTNAEIFTYYLK